MMIEDFHQDLSSTIIASINASHLATWFQTTTLDEAVIWFQKSSLLGLVQEAVTSVLTPTWGWVQNKQTNTIWFISSKQTKHLIRIYGFTYLKMSQIRALPDPKLLLQSSLKIEHM